MLASIFYANRLSYSIWNTTPGKFIREDLEHHGVTYDDLIDYWKITEPSQALPKVQKENILLISGKHDHMCILRIQTTCGKLGKTYTIYLYMWACRDRS